MPDVLVVGAGPVGLTLAAELARHNVRSRIIDRLSAPNPYCRAIGVTPRTLEVYEDMGVARQMIDAGLWIGGLRAIVHGRPPVDQTAPDLGLPYGFLGVPQYETERVLTRHLGRLGIQVERGMSLIDLQQTTDSVVARLRDDTGRESQASFRYLVGCDGAHSTVRRTLGIGFPGEAFPMMFMLGDVRIDWDLPRGWSLRAVRPIENAAPDIFIAIPLPETGRYRVSMLAANELAVSGGTDHGIQSELSGPGLEQVQAVADRLLPDRTPLSDLRWSSLFRISMRLADHYQKGRAFIAGDAAHIHPPTGGQGMNTGIQDAYNLAWKLALVLEGVAPSALLDSYEEERRPVGADVVSRTRTASERLGREPGGKIDRSDDTQTLISYRETGWVARPSQSGQGAFPGVGDRAPDAIGLRRHGVGFPLRLYEILRGPEHVLVVHSAQADPSSQLVDLSGWSQKMRTLLGARLRVVAVTAAVAPDQPNLAVLHDAAETFAKTYDAGSCLLIRPDKHIAWRGTFWGEAELTMYLARTFEKSMPS